ncbi:carbohydrate esterase family 5 protein [Viridothelium virens]|uniref:Cutinase n=1 Tax=Viridothelium virens TaxID=1048519 RepID=A0A6A6HKT4_VIRVR|nr:carbohydrate esterase family 5 protein [Viridothelium virens]
MAGIILTSLLALGATALPQSIPSGGLTGQTANDIQNGACKPTSFIFARGTTETGNLGETVGPALVKDLQQMLGAGNVAVQGVNYPADIAGAAEGSTNPKGAQGSQNMAMFAAKAVQQCPTTKLVLSGYSQGAQQVHGALLNMDSATTGKVAAAVTFGDPLDKTMPQFQGVPAANTKIFCAQGDQVCNDQFIISAAHLSYAKTSTGPAAQFISSKLGGGASNTATNAAA